MYKDDVTKAEFNQAYVAHIVADVPGGPRGHATRSNQLKSDIKNLMLLCDVHHRLIDKAMEKEHPEYLLLEMKKEHEERIERITSLSVNMQSHIVIYKANIGEHSPVITYESVGNYLFPKYYPAESHAVELGTTDSPLRDKNDSFWVAELEVLETNFKQRILPRIKNQSIKHISLFAFAPIPLLVKLGTLLNDIQNVEIHQPIRNPKGWNLSEDKVETEYRINEPPERRSSVALNISLSGNISDNRIISVLGNDVAIYTITVDNPNNDYLQSKEQLVRFIEEVKKTLNKIKLMYGASVPLHIFPAMPVATAIELGRSWMPKADMPMILYDENKINDGFKKAIEIF